MPAMDDDAGKKEYDLEERAFRFAKNIRCFVKKLPRNVCNMQDVPQLVRSSGSVGANYIEANDSLSKKDFLMRVKISRREAKESIYWLRLMDVGTEPALEKDRAALVQEATELMKILGAIFRKSE